MDHDQQGAGPRERGEADRRPETPGEEAGVVAVWLTAFGAPATRASARLVEVGPAQRASRALLALGACWGGALLAIFIPVAHLVLVPGLLVAGVVLAVRQLRQHRRILGAEGACPRCGAAARYEVSGGFSGERALECPRCHARVVLTATPPPGASD